jgi:hypothetical protein
MNVEAGITARPLEQASHAWCSSCNAISPAVLERTRAVPSDRRFSGRDLKCRSCGFTIATTYEEMPKDSFGGA